MKVIKNLKLYVVYALSHSAFKKKWEGSQDYKSEYLFHVLLLRFLF